MKIEVATFVPDVLETTSILHVTLLVFLRLLAVTEPIKYKQIHISLRHKSIIITWTISLGVRLIGLMIQIFQPSFLLYYRHFSLHTFNTLPILCIVMMYFKLMITLKKRKKILITMTENSRHSADLVNRKMTEIVKRIVLALLICYVPFLIWEQYQLIIIEERVPFIIYTNEVRN